MQNPVEEQITIKPKTKNNGLFLIFLGVLLIFISMFINLLFWDEYKIQLMLLFLTCSIVLLTGILKYSEPEVSYKLTRQQLCLYHRNGNWQLNWESIVRLGQPSANTIFENINLPYIGIKLKDMALIADNISPRLANKLIHEQRELLILAVRNNEIKLESGLISFEPFTLNNKVYKGPIAAWLFRTEQLHQVYGYHLFLPDSGFDRKLGDFLTLLKQCKEYANTI
ncbi:DUF2982 domain-containing protein [Pseudocolwellia sp. HL-MZ7]|uniref:DUF2982 domain-containing protein n=1 Tax=Pseudocolwellia sp. HL-MZ7 TaxID=3400627 RepID=UPI003CE8D439